MTEGRNKGNRFRGSRFDGEMMTKVDGKEREWDLEERTARFGESVVLFAKRIPGGDVNSVLVQQLVRSGTSIGANYCEANDAESKKDFRHKIGICRKESKETKHWCRMIAAAEPTFRIEAQKLWLEAKQLNLIFGKIRRSLDDP